MLTEKEYIIKVLETIQDNLDNESKTNKADKNNITHSIDNTNKISDNKDSCE